VEKDAATRQQAGKPATAKITINISKVGINRYLGKPFNETELLENINALLNERSTPVPRNQL